MLTLSSSLSTQGWYSVGVDLTVSDLEEGKGIGMEATSKDGRFDNDEEKECERCGAFGTDFRDSQQGERTIMPTIVIQPTSTEPITIYVLTTRVDSCWARPGEYIRQNMLIALPEQAGHRAPNKILQDDVIPEALIPRLEDKLVVDVIRNSER